MTDDNVSTVDETVHTKSMNKKFRLLPWIICGVGALFYAYEYVLRISPNVMSTELMQYYNISALALGNLSAFYYYAYTPMQLPVGVMMDRFGPRRLLTFACILCAIGSYLFASSHSMALAGFGRFLVGFGSAFAFVGVLKLATIWLPPDRFAFISGFTSALGAVGAVFGEVSMTHLVSTIGWRSTVIFTAISGVILAIIIIFVVRDKKHKEIAEGTPGPLDLPQICLGFLNIMKNPYIWLNGLIGCLLYLPASAFAELWGDPYLQRAHHLTSDEAAWGISLIFLGFAIGGPFFGWLSDHIKRRKLPMMLGGSIAAIIISVILYVPLSKILLFVLLFFFGASYGAQVIVFAVGREISPVRLSGTAIAVTNMLVMLGGVIFQPLIGGLLDLGWNGVLVNNVPAYSVADFKQALVILPICLLIGVALASLLKETHAHIEKDAKGE